MPPTPVRAAALAWLAAALTGGCGPAAPKHAPAPRIDCVPAGGEVTVKGAPAEAARLTFYPLPFRNDGIVYRAVTDAQGKFEGTTNTPNDGLPPGRYAVTITWPVLLQEDPEYEQDRLGWQYANLHRPSFFVDVATPSTRFATFQLN